MQLFVDELTCNRGGRDVFAGLSFSLRGGEALIVAGRNGAGKSSLLRVVAGLVRAAAGTLVLRGGNDDLSVAEQCHYIGHQDALKPALSAAENLTFWADYLGGAGSIAKALDAVGLRTLADLPAAYLSAGQRRRLSLARLVAVKRPVWLLDEPDATLDAPAQQKLTAIMNTHLKSGGIILAAAHEPLGLKRARKLRLGPA
jgi:heme exporter protein A